jgi:sialate O-acetylesterase
MRLNPFRGLVLAAALLACLPSAADAQELKLPSVFGDQMVLQREMPVPVWGWGKAGETVSVTFGEQSQSTEVGDDGKWMLKLDPLSVGEPRELTVKSGEETTTFSDVLVGEVWVCSGQSNMQWSIAVGLDPDLEAARADRPNLRLFQLPQVSKAEPQDDVEASWRVSAPADISSFSAVAYFFGINLQETLDVPVGLVQTAWGGTRAEAWTSPEKMAEVEELKPILDAWAQRIENYDPEAAKARNERVLATWRANVATAREAGRAAPRRPQPIEDPTLDRHRPSNLYNGMIAPLVPFAMRGAIWYQGESNAGRAYQYRTLMPAMIQSWRDAWEQGDFPFYQVQLANYDPAWSREKHEPGDSNWAELREAQFLTTQALPNVGAACITDIGAAKDIHPKNKQDVGKRLARLALVDVYGMGDKLVRNGPVYKSMSVEGHKATLTFDVGRSNLIPWYNEELTDFAIAGEDQKFVWANARIVGPDTIEVWSDEVAQPLAVRYNWSNNPQGNLYNAHYLPAYPFRTDDWRGVTAENVTP